MWTILVPREPWNSRHFERGKITIRAVFVMRRSVHVLPKMPHVSDLSPSLSSPPSLLPFLSYLGRASTHKFVCTTALGRVQARSRILSRVCLTVTSLSVCGNTQSMSFKIMDKSPWIHAKQCAFISLLSRCLKEK